MRRKTQSELDADAVDYIETYTFRMMEYSEDGIDDGDTDGEILSYLSELSDYDDDDNSEF